MPNNLPSTGQERDDGLAEIFLSSIKLKAQVTLLSGRYHFRSAGIRDAFDPKMMTSEEGAEMNHDWTVLIALFPALVRLLEPPSGMEDGKEVTIFPATVLLHYGA